MKPIAFIHGSSDGQSTIIPPDSPISVCTDIASKYFGGRSLRQKGSSAKLCLFVDLYKDATNSGKYCVFSFVNNECRGTSHERTGQRGRSGQYFAITILYDAYVYPETVYKMLSSAYNQMYATGKVMHKNEEGEDQYVIPQFSDQQQYLLALLQKIKDAFSNVASSQSRVVTPKAVDANYDSWEGVKVNVSNCNSDSVYNEFCETGRIFVSDEYESSLVVIKKLEKKIRELEIENEKLEKEVLDAKHSAKSKAKQEIDNLEKRLNEKDKHIAKLEEDNNTYQSSINVVTGELEKFAKVGKSVINAQNTESQYKNHNKKELLKICLLILLLILTVICGICNYIFFRNLTQNTTNEGSEAQEEIVQPEDDKSGEGTSAVFLNIEPQSIEAEANQGEYEIEIRSSKDWEIQPSTVHWVAFTKDDDSHLKIRVQQNSTNSPREYTFMVTSEAGEKQIRISQQGKAVSTPQTNYGLKITDSSGRLISSGSTILRGQIITATVSNPSQAANGYGWTYSKCTGAKGNLKSVTITITGNPGENVAIGYGDLNNQQGRQRVYFKIIDNSGSANLNNTDTDTN